MDIRIIFNEEEQEAQAFDGEKKIGYCQYEKEDGTYKLTHTVVDKAYGGRGLAGSLVDCLVDHFRASKKKILPICSYAVKKFDNDKKYADVDARN